jgi:hypothetical protein
MKTAGWLLIIIAVATIWINVSTHDANRRLINEHPIKSGIFGENVKPAYTFTAPYSGFELLIIGMGITGVVLVIIGQKAK